MGWQGLLQGRNMPPCTIHVATLLSVAEKAHHLDNISGCRGMYIFSGVGGFIEQLIETYAFSNELQ